FSQSEIVRVLGSHDTTRKFLLRLNDESLIETVLIPASPALYGSRSDRRTICISTQVGCAYGCKFCASGLEGFSRNLKPNEIVDQIIAVERKPGKKQRLTFEYILIAGVNDFDEQARALTRQAKRLSAKVNLIPYNTVHGLVSSRPAQDRQEKFLSILRERGVAATLRREKGHDID